MQDPVIAKALRLKRRACLGWMSGRRLRERMSTILIVEHMVHAMMMAYLGNGLL